MSGFRETPAYGNCVITAPDGQMLCRTSEKRIQWYVSRNLGDIVSYDPTTLRLRFEPKGRDGAAHPYTTGKKDNICVVCGSEEQITKHHVVPRCFRKHFPSHKKEHAVHDVLLLCVDCHNKYEEFALDLKKKIANDYNITFKESCHFDQYARIRSAGTALLKHYDKIPEIRRTELLDRLREFFDKKEITEADLVYAKNMKPLLSLHLKLFGQLVVEKLEDVDQFIILWRKHFVEFMSPQHLPNHWNVDSIL